MKENGEKYMTVAEASRRLSKTRITVERWVNNGKLSHTKFAGKTFVLASSVEAYLNAQNATKEQSNG